MTAGRGSFNLLSALESKVDIDQQQKSRKVHSFGLSADAADDMASHQQTRPAAPMPSSTTSARCTLSINTCHYVDDPRIVLCWSSWSVMSSTKVTMAVLAVMFDPKANVSC